jgi:hypothetical protein
VAEKKSLALLAELEQAGAISVVGLHLARPDLPYEQFEALCVMLGKLHEAVRFAIGDAIREGEKLYGEKAYEAIEQMNLSVDARLEYVRVASKVPRSVRRPDLSWSHHRAVATLEPPEQKKWLRKASDEQMSHHTLREELKLITDKPEPARNVCRCCKRPLDG